MEHNKLKPCPFCGKPVTRVRGFYGLNFFKCNNSGGCGAVMSFDNDYYNDNPEQAFEAFNKRADEQKINELTEENKKLLHELTIAEVKLEETK